MEFFNKKKRAVFTWIDFNELFHEIIAKVCEILTVQKKWEVDSASKLREQSGFSMSWK